MKQAAIVLLICFSAFSKAKERYKLSFLTPSSTDFKFLDFDPILIPDIIIEAKNIPLNLVVVSNGNYMRKMNWFSPVLSSIFDSYSSEANKQHAENWIIFSAASSETPKILLDGRNLKKNDDLGKIVKEGRIAVDLMANTQSNQDTVKLLKSFNKYLEAKKLEVGNLTFFITTEWNFSPIFNKGEPENSLKSLLDYGVSQINFVQLHEGGDFGINSEFETAFKKSISHSSGKIILKNFHLSKIVKNIDGLADNSPQTSFSDSQKRIEVLLNEILF